MRYIISYGPRGPPKFFKNIIPQNVLIDNKSLN